LRRQIRLEWFCRFLRQRTALKSHDFSYSERGFLCSRSRETSDERGDNTNWEKTLRCQIRLEWFRHFWRQRTALKSHDFSYSERGFLCS